MKFRKKPIVVEAIEVSDLLLTDVGDWPIWMKEAYQQQKVGIFQKGLSISTLEGTMEALKDDYIIQGVNGEIYPCKSDIFEKTYEPIN